MRKRPWEILLLTILYSGAPLGNLIFTCVAGGYAFTDLPWVLMAMGPWDLLALAVYPALAVAVWSVSRPGWWIFLVLNLGLFAYNLWVGAQVPGANLVVLVGANALNVGVAALLFTKHARSPYFSPRLRWWNAEVRYRVVYVLDVPLTVRQGLREGQGLLLDLSVTGCFADLPAGFNTGDPVELSFECWGLTIQCQGRILRHSRPEESLQGYGIQFQQLTGDQKYHLKSLVKVLKAHHVPSREEVVTIGNQSNLPAQTVKLSGSASAKADESLQ